MSPILNRKCKIYATIFLFNWIWLLTPKPSMIAIMAPMAPSSSWSSYSLAFQAGTANNFWFRIENQLFSALNPIFRNYSLKKTLNCHIFFGAFDLFPWLWARPKPKLSPGTKCQDVLLLYLIFTNTFGYAHLWWATVNKSQSGYGFNAIKRYNKYKKGCFWPLQKISMGQVC